MDFFGVVLLLGSLCSGGGLGAGVAYILASSYLTAILVLNSAESSGMVRGSRRACGFWRCLGALGAGRVGSFDPVGQA